MGARTDDRTIDEKGRVTIPKDIRDRLDLEPGTEVTVQLQEGRIVLVPGVSREEFIERMEGCIDESTATGEPIDPRSMKSMWTEDLPSET